MSTISHNTARYNIDDADRREILNQLRNLNGHLAPAIMPPMDIVDADAEAKKILDERRRHSDRSFARSLGLDTSGPSKPIVAAKTELELALDKIEELNAEIARLKQGTTAPNTAAKPGQFNWNEVTAIACQVNWDPTLLTDPSRSKQRSVKSEWFLKLEAHGGNSQKIFNFVTQPVHQFMTKYAAKYQSLWRPETQQLIADAAKLGVNARLGFIKGLVGAKAKNTILPNQIALLDNPMDNPRVVLLIDGIHHIFEDFVIAKGRSDEWKTKGGYLWYEQIRL